MKLLLALKSVFYKPDNTVFTGGNIYTSSQGTFENNIWDVGTVPAGGSATLTVNLFIMTEDGLTAFVQVEDATGQDTDSTPGNGNPITPNEDDEAAADINGGAGGDNCEVSVNFAYPFCDNNGTPNDNSDDVFYFSIRATGSNTSTSWTANFQGQQLTGPYNTTLQFGPYPLSAANSTFAIADPADPNCTASVTVQGPIGGTCSGGGGGLACTNNLIQNGGFENGLTGWTMGNGDPANAFTNTNDAYSGNAALRMDADQQLLGSVSLSQEVPVNDPNGQYTLSFFGKRIWDIAPENPADGHVRIFYKNTGGTVLGNDIINRVLALSYSEYAKTVTLPANTASVSVVITLFSSGDFGEGTILLDDICFRKTSSQMADLEVLQVNCPNNFPQPGEPLNLSIEVRNNGTLASGPTPLYFNRQVSCAQCISHDPHGSVTIPPILAGATQVVNVTTNNLADPLAFPGTYCFEGGPTSVSCKSYFGYFFSWEVAQFPASAGSFDFYCKKYTTDLAVEIIPNGPTYGNDGLINFILRVSNNGNADAYNVAVNAFDGITLPNADPMNIITSGLGFDITLNDTQWSLPFVAANSTMDINVTYNSLGVSQFPTPPDDYTVATSISSGHLENEPNTANNDDSFTFTKEGGGGGDIDLEISLVQPNANPDQWSSYNVIATLTNTGGQTATGVRVNFQKPDGVVYEGGNEYTASQGDFVPGGIEIWEVGSLPAGGSATFEVNYFLLEPNAPTAYIEVYAANETDTDSTPNNGTPPTPNEDDEASTDGSSGQLPDLVAGNLAAGIDPLNGIQVLYTSFKVENVGAPLPNDPLTINAAFYLSDDAILDSNDRFLRDMGLVKISTSTVYFNSADLFSIVPLVPTGDYYIIAKVDDGEIYNETNENNNTTAIAVSITGVNAPDLMLMDLNLQNPLVQAGQVLNYDFDISNIGDEAVPGNFNVKAWISTDGIISNDDIQDGIVPTGNYGAGLTVADVQGSSTIPANLPDGLYFLLLKVDADEEVTEANEGNNLITALFTIGTPCQLFITESELVCNDNGTLNTPLDDLYTLFLNVNGTGIDPITDTYHVSGDFTAGFVPYGSLQPIDQITLPAVGTVLNYTVYDISGNCHKTAATPPLNGCSGTGGDIDLSLSMSATNNNPPIYSSVEVTLTISNDGSQTATGIVVEFSKPSGTVYTGGNEWSATQGSFNPFGNEQWAVGDVPDNGTASITVSYFLLTGNTLTPYADVAAANETDGDSTPGNGTCCTPNEDDEAAITLNNFTGGGGGNSFKINNNGQRLAFKSIYPTPVKYWVTLEVYSKDNQPIVLDFYNQQGQSVHRMEVEVEEGLNEIGLDVSEWRSGGYNVIGRGNGHPAYGRIVKVWE